MPDSKGGDIDPTSLWEQNERICEHISKPPHHLPTRVHAGACPQRKANEEHIPDD